MTDRYLEEAMLFHNTDFAGVITSRAREGQKRSG